MPRSSSVHPVLAPTLSKGHVQARGSLNCCNPLLSYLQGRSAVRTKRAGEGFWNKMAWSIEPT
ncbi:hypothetical protein M758_9G090500 [Ceratodon purpureus]|nr:hypothetical protein M758_9G090500 [Ceratodon purpureus]